MTSLSTSTPPLNSFPEGPQHYLPPRPPSISSILPSISPSPVYLPGSSAHRTGSPPGPGQQQTQPRGALGNRDAQTGTMSQPLNVYFDALESRGDDEIFLFLLFPLLLLLVSSPHRGRAFVFRVLVMVEVDM
ncbi:hypothetical protein E2C01_031359 [Portunus trituberculatus]|uniref:Uncharacterized protein n=1 Tax=Portunus trituberculatus TaxID=210409 RepID=A0A5B7EZV6_PORTR|nr:hypothetical protein [Portunus trituberculatus]